MGKPSVEPLIACLKDERSDVRQDVAEALGKLGDVNAVDPLVVCLKDEDSDVRQCAAEALTKLKWTPLDEQTRITFIIATRNWQDIVKIDKPAVLVECIKDKNPVVRQCAAEAMGNLGDPCTVGTLIACLRDKNEYVRQSAVLALGKFGKPAVEPLIACLKDEDWPVRESAAEMLGKIGDPRAVEPLIDALPDWEMDVKIVEALRKLDWQPKTDREKIYLWICKKDGKSLREHWEQAEKVLMEDVSSGEKRRVENTVFTVISLGKEEMIDKSIQVLDQQGDKGMAEVYLNCGNSRLRQAAEKWARSHGYPILNGAGRNDASWGKW
jgi:HEAT repeat protein